LNRTRGVSSVIAILTGVIEEVTSGAPAAQIARLGSFHQNWFEEKRWQDNQGITYVSMLCRTCGKTLGGYSSDYLPASFCPHCRAREIGQSVDTHDATRRPARPKLPLYDLAIAGIQPFAKRAFSNEPFEPGPHYAAYESSVQEIMVRLELGEPEASIVAELEEKRKQTPAGDYSWNSMRFWRIQEAVRDAKALLALNFKSFPLLEAKEQFSGPQQYPDRHSPDAWYRVHRLDVYDDEWECKACGKRGPNYARGTERPPKFCPYCGSEKERS
jgi:rubrerythrin